MLILRKAQIDALSAPLKERFVRLMATHLEGHVPARCAALGPDATRGQIIDGIAKAEALGIVAEQDVAGVLHFMFETTMDFDRARGFEWAVAALRDHRLEPSERVDRLYADWAARKATRGTA